MFHEYLILFIFDYTFYTVYLLHLAIYFLFCTINDYLHCEGKL